jgi:hypothetical protein
MTPRLSDHARQRCREMGIGTKQVKHLVRSPKITRRSGAFADRMIVYDEALAVVYAHGPDGVPIVITVLHREDFTRPENLLAG